MLASCLLAEWFSWRLDSVCVSVKCGAPPYSHSEAISFFSSFGLSQLYSSPWPSVLSSSASTSKFLAWWLFLESRVKAAAEGMDSCCPVGCKASFFLASCLGVQPSLLLSQLTEWGWQRVLSPICY